MIFHQRFRMSRCNLESYGVPVPSGSHLPIRPYPHCAPATHSASKEGLHFSPAELPAGTTTTLAAECERLARIPLLFQPGAEWNYG